MNEWWGGLGLLNRVMFGGAAFFSVLFIWQLISAFLGLSDESVDIDDISDDGYDAQTGEDASETIEAFKLLGGPVNNNISDFIHLGVCVILA